MGIIKLIWETLFIAIALGAITILGGAVFLPEELQKKLRINNIIEIQTNEDRQNALILLGLAIILTIGTILLMKFAEMGGILGNIF